MENKDKKPYPWYDDRVTLLHEEAPAPPGWDDDDALSGDEGYDYGTPKEIYGYLDRHVCKQDAAKKAAAIIAYNCFCRGVKSNAMFAGPSGCGKTYIWRCLKDIFPGRIEIVDGSNMTMDGWKGEKKWATLLRSPIFRDGKKTILVIDEADKMLAPKYTGGENVSHGVQAEGLSMMEGTHVEVKDNSVAYDIDTAGISFVFCGAFSARATEIAEKEGGARIGFGASAAGAKAYGRPLTATDLIEFGVMPEFMGRIQRIVSLEPLTADDYYRMSGDCGFLQRIGRQYRAEVRLAPQVRRELAEEACHSGLGVRGLENQIRAMLDEAIFEDCGQRRITLQAQHRGEGTA